MTFLALCGAGGLGVWASAGLGACAPDHTEPFQCGVQQDGQSGVIQECAGEHEICVCANNSCARPITTAKCQSGYQYLEPPFVTRRAIDEVETHRDAGAADAGEGAPEDPASRCVPVGLLDWKIEKSTKLRTCSDQDGGATGGTGGTGGTTATGGTGGMTGTGGTGGMTGTGGTGGMTSTGGTGGMTSTGGSGGTTSSGGTGGTP